MKNIVELKNERKKLTSLLKDKSIAQKKALFFASHYSYLDKRGMQIILLIITFFLGLLLSFFKSLFFFLPYILWVGYDIYRMDDLIRKYNEPVIKQLSEVNELIEKHMKVKTSIEHTLKFLERFNKKAS